jgi:hypothetical protein
MSVSYDVPSPHGSVILKDVMVTLSPADIVTVFKIRSAADVPTLPCNITTPAFDLMRKWPAVMLAAAVAAAIALAVAVARPLAVALVEAGKAVAFMGSVTPSVPASAVSVVASCTPERINRFDVVVHNAVRASSAALAAIMDMTGRAAI